jgi:hypothetical protein
MDGRGLNYRWGWRIKWVLTGFLAPLVLVHQWLVAAASGRYVEATAEITMKWASPTNPSVLAIGAQYRAICTIGLDRWRIDHNFSRNADIQMFWDGTNVYECTLPRPDPPSHSDMTNQLAKMGIASLPYEAVKDMRFIDITPGGQPLTDAGANLAWLAFCSGPYLKGLPETVPLPLQPPRISPDSFAYAAKVVCYEDELGLPSQVEWSGSRAAAAAGRMDYRLSRNNRMLWFRSAAWRPPREGILRASYRVLESTNFLGWRFPVSFEAVRYGGLGFSDGTISCTASGRLTALREADPPRTVLCEGSDQGVTDYRFRSKGKLVDLIDYPWTNSAVPPADDPKLLALFGEKESRADPDPGLALRNWRVTLVVLVLFGPLLLLAATCWRRFGQTKVLKK